MKIIFAYSIALILSLINGKLVAGAISGIILSPIAKPLEHVKFVDRYLIPFLQGIAMGGVAVFTAQWVLAWFDFPIAWLTVGLLLIGFVVICSYLSKNCAERQFHLSAGVGEVLGICLAGAYFLMR